MVEPRFALNPHTHLGKQNKTLHLHILKVVKGDFYLFKQPEHKDSVGKSKPQTNIQHSLNFGAGDEVEEESVPC